MPWGCVGVQPGCAGPCHDGTAGSTLPGVVFFWGGGARVCGGVQRVEGSKEGRGNSSRGGAVSVLGRMGHGGGGGGGGLGGAGDVDNSS